MKHRKIQQIKVHSGWDGWGTPEQADVLIHPDQDVFSPNKIAACLNVPVHSKIENREFKGNRS